MMAKPFIRMINHDKNLESKYLNDFELIVEQYVNI